MASNIKLKNNIESELSITHSDNEGAVEITSTQLKNIRQVDTIADLRAMTDTQNTIWVSGYHTKDDGAFGSNVFRWNPTSTEDDNSGTIIKLDSVATGRYELQYDGAVNVKWFGAVGDGVTDDTAAIQAALDAITDRTALDLAGGTYAVGNLTTDKNGISIKNGKLIGIVGTVGALLTITGDKVKVTNVEMIVDSVLFSDDIGLITFNGVTGGYVSNCHLSGSRRNSSGESRSYMVCVYNSSSVIISDNIFDEAYYTEMVYLDSSLDCVVSDNVMSTENGLAYSAIGSTNSLGLTGYANHVITGNTCRNFKTSIITVNGTKGVTVSGNTVDTSAEEQGINIGHTDNGADECTITGNTVLNCNGDGIVVADSSDCVVSGNLIVSCGENGVVASGDSSGIIISGNNIKNIGNGAYGNGVKLSASFAADITISGNYFQNLQGHGVELNGQPVNILISSNTFKNINTAGLDGGRFPVGGSLGTTSPCETLIFDGNTVLGPTTINRVISVYNSDSDMLLRIINNTLPALTTTAQMFWKLSGDNPLCRDIQGNVISPERTYSVATLTGGTTSVVISNANQTPYAAPIIYEGDNDAAQCEVYVSSYGAGTFTISSRLTPSYDAKIWYKIV